MDAWQGLNLTTKKKYEHISLDLETLGTDSDAAIVSIGAVKFNLEDKETSAEIHSDKSRLFYGVIRLSDSMAEGGVINPKTLEWWMNQSDEARKVFSRDTIKNDTIHTFADFNRFSGYGEYELWGNGAGFDNVILAAAIKRAGMTVSWKFTQDRDLRTIMMLGLKKKGLEKPLTPRVGTHHNALDDAIHQARVAQEMWGYLNETPPVELDTTLGQKIHYGKIFSLSASELASPQPPELQPYNKGILKFQQAMKDLNTFGMEPCFENGSFERPKIDE